MRPKKYNLYRKKKKQSKYIIVSTIISLFLISSIFLINIFSNIDRDSLIGKWKSELTNQVVYFTSDGEVKLDSTDITGTYHIISPNTMEYTISDMSFEMMYKIDDNKLYWGVDESKFEVFIPK